MTKGEKIVAEIEGCINDSAKHLCFDHHWPRIKAALLAWQPVSPLRTILDRIEKRQAQSPTFSATPTELAAANAELDRLEDNEKTRCS